MKLFLYPYNLGSASAKALREGLSKALGYRVKMVRPHGRYRPRRDDIVLNWGNTTFPTWMVHPEQDLNPSFRQRMATNKIDTFRILKNNNVPTPEWTTNKQEAAEWLTKSDVVCRTILNGHSGAGIVLVERGGTLVNAPLYVKYKKKKHEYRVHVFMGEVIDVAQKKKRRAADADAKIRNHQNGWVYAREDIMIPHDLYANALAAIRALRLDFGAVDLIYNERDNATYVLEINTAPGIEGTTLTKYVEAIKNVL